ncbi:CBS domain-containing protein CBSCBSPB3-like [Impatiens glandulifera]|uniref:CBS domain-containing protein CBSCBSPB3-like n=1 Tax=Impatiens glandulifera TaxID=253017 RepID=UPI001FB0D572|nr:CBS domain-containing protein CBSCBSPB3-like [Impatiens glandulifera]
MSTQLLHPVSRRNGKRNPSSIGGRSSVQPDNTTSNGTHQSKPSSPDHPFVVGARTVKKLRLSKALTIPEGTTVSDACRRMASRRVDAVLLTDSNALLAGIVTDKDIATRVIAEGLRPDQTLISKVMTKNPIFVSSDSLAIDALQKMIQGKFRHLPVVENGEVIALLDITKCLYDAISRMEKAAEQGSAIAAAVEGVERHFGSNFSGPSAFIETLRERMFKPSLSTIIGENARVAIVSPSDSVYTAAKKMQELKVNSVLIVVGKKTQGILTSKDIFLRVVAQNLSPQLTSVEKVMTRNPESATVDTTILEALHVMHDGKFLHLPVMDKDGTIVACVDVLQITHAAISIVENSSGAVNDVANTVMHKFWDSAFSLDPPDDFDNRSEMSMSRLALSDVTELDNLYPAPGVGNSFTFKFTDRNSRVHRITFGTDDVNGLVSAVMQRAGAIDNYDRPRLLYEDDEGDKVIVTTDSDLMSAVSYARSIGLKVLRLYLDYSDLSPPTTIKGSSPPPPPSSSVATAIKRGEGGLTNLRYGILASAVAVTGIGVLVHLNRPNV